MWTEVLNYVNTNVELRGQKCQIMWTKGFNYVDKGVELCGQKCQIMWTKGFNSVDRSAEHLGTPMLKNECISFLKILGMLNTFYFAQ
jgi:hypothetical protein